MTENFVIFKKYYQSLKLVIFVWNLKNQIIIYILVHEQIYIYMYRYIINIYNKFICIVTHFNINNKTILN